MAPSLKALGPLVPRLASLERGLSPGSRAVHLPQSRKSKPDIAAPGRASAPEIGLGVDLMITRDPPRSRDLH